MLVGMRWLVAAAMVACSGGSSPAVDKAPKAGSAAPAPAAAAATVAPTTSGGTKQSLVEGGVRPHHEEPVVECPAKIVDSAGYCGAHIS